MVSRLYASSRSLWEQVETAIAALDVGRGRPRRLVEVMALYVTGLILLEKGQTAVRIAMVLPGRAHDALNRLLRVLPWSPHQLILSLARWVQRQTGPGYLCLDDVVVEKPFAKLLAWAGWTYSHSRQRHVFGFHIVLLFWCNTRLRIPVGFRLWRTKREGMAPYRSKLELAQSLISNVLRAGLTFEYLTFDLWYNARSFTKWLTAHEIIWVSTLKSNALITYRGRTGDPPPAAGCAAHPDQTRSGRPDYEAHNSARCAPHVRHDDPGRRRAGLPVVQQLMGHANVATTAQYDRSTEETKRSAAVGLIHTSYRRSAP
jgi:DDE superfamily endonuclease